MGIEEHLPELSEVVNKQLIFLERRNVQFQLLVVVFGLIISWLISKWFWNKLQSHFPQKTKFVWSDGRLPPNEYVAALLENIDFPLISLIVIHLILKIFIIQNWTRGLLHIAIQLILIYLVYRLFLVSLYAVFPLAKIRQYHHRLFTPLLVLLVFLRIITLSNELGRIAQISPLKLFNSPVSLGAIFLLTFGLYFWIVTVTFVEYIFLEIASAGSQKELGSLQATLILIRYFLITMGIVLTLGYIGVNGTALAAITGGLSVGIGFGLQQVVSNFVSGILLLFEGVLKPGDIIDIEGKTSVVTKLGIRATLVKILQDNSEKIIPNQTFFTSDVTTYTGSDPLVNCSTIIGVGYDSNAKQVMALLLQIADEHPRILKNPAPLAFFLNFGDSSLNFELKFWLDDINIRKRVISEVNCAILEEFNQHQIEIPFPQRDIHIRSG